MKQIKLVVWDLDDTFWAGTFSEGPVTYSPNNHEIVVELAKRGIVSSICSKNDAEPIIQFLTTQGIRDYFVAPSIDWTSKGSRINKLISDLGLRATNVLFLDDIPLNLEEVRSMNPDIHTAGPEFIEEILRHPALLGKPDPELKRLEQYRVIEKKIIERATSNSSNEDFLRSSGIQISIRNVKQEDLARIEDLVNRSNQLNFTKKRVPVEELSKTFVENPSACHAIWVRDRFGDYGLAGYFELHDDELSQYVFSCRILGMGVEKYVYNKLGNPKLNIVGDVVSDVSGGELVDWISEVDVFDNSTKTITADSAKLMIKGGCDLRQLKGYLVSNIETTEEMNYVAANGFPVHNEHTEILKRANSAYLQEFSHIIEKVAFLDNDAFQTNFFAPEFNFVLYSVLMDYTQGLYQLRGTSFCVPYGQFNVDARHTQSLRDRYGDEFAEWFSNNFDFLGPLTPDAFRENLNWMVEQLAPHQHLLLVNGAEIVLDHQVEVDRWKHHKVMNAVLDDVAEGLSNTSVIDVRNIVTAESHVTNNIRHYTREIYLLLAQEIDAVLGSLGVEQKIEHKPAPQKSSRMKLLQRFKR